MRGKHNIWLRRSLLAICAIAMSACATSPPRASGPTPSAAGPASTDPRVPSVANSPQNQERLKALWDKRSGQVTNEDYPVGPGDVMQISVAGVDDLKEREVRVSGEGQMELPLIGIVQVNGLTEAGVRDKIAQALTKYMYSPQVDVFVKEYHSRQVAVVGAVRNPGLIMLTGGESILDAITQAGGMTADAADEIVILPEMKGGRSKLMELASSYEQDPKPGDPSTATAARTMPNEPPQASSQDMTGAAPPTGITLASLEQNISNGPAIVIPLKSAASFRGSINFTNMPVEPGDIIVVPGGGNVMVTGWVYKPGFFSVGSGLTVLGAVGSAGGVMYAGEGTEATLIRSDESGNKVSLPVNLDKIATGAEPDIPVRANDVIDVPYSDLRIGPYVVYNILSRMAVPIPAF